MSKLTSSGVSTVIWSRSLSFSCRQRTAAAAQHDAVLAREGAESGVELLQGVFEARSTVPVVAGAAGHAPS